MADTIMRGMCEKCGESRKLKKHKGSMVCSSCAIVMTMADNRPAVVHLLMNEAGHDVSTEHPGKKTDNETLSGDLAAFVAKAKAGGLRLVGVGKSNNSGVSMSSKVRHGQRPVHVITIYSDTMSRLGWKRGERVVIHHDQASGWCVIVKAVAGASPCYKLIANCGSRLSNSAMVRFSDALLNEVGKRRNLDDGTDYHVVDGALVVRWVGK